MKIKTAILASIGALGLATTAHATTWASLTSDNFSAGTVSGTIGSVNVTYSGGYNFDNLNGTGTNYWGSVPVPNSDIIALSAAGTGVITFSAPVTNVYIAFDSWNGANVTFSAPFTIISQAPQVASYWGSGTFNTFGGNTGFTGSGETAGVLEFAGTFTSLSFTDSVDENWHGLTVGVDGLASNAVPEPATWALMLLGFGMVGYAMRKRGTVRTTLTYA